MRQLYLALGCILMSPSLYAATQYRVTELAPTAGFAESYASSINNLGQIAGSSTSYTIAANKYYINSQATLWTQNSQTVITTAPMTTSYAFAINNAGQVAGDVYNTRSKNGVLLIDNPNPVTATVWNNGSATYLSSLGGTQSSALALNDQGQVVGVSADGQSRKIATLWENGTVTALTTPELLNSVASAINNNGMIAGEVSGGDYTFTTQAVVWNNNVLTYLSIGGQSQAFDINNDNQIVGWSNNQASGRQYASLWENGVETNLSVVDSFASYAYAINNHGSIVGSYISNGIGEEFAAIWENGNATKLENLLINGNGISLYTANDINDQGWIVANGVNSNGEYRSFLLMPVPEPENQALFLVGLTVIGIRLSKRLS
jgi:probable HAF family extracellular repeat protein